MGELAALPLGRSVALPDVRGDRALQMTWHDDPDVVVVSLWRDGRCAGTVRLDPAEAAAMIAALGEGLERHERRAGAGSRHSA
ncbi:hypothetical protein [Actinotalea sp. Marseille-Q4924]|uniref:hypothetical protein n=1 Tax=Actinotalea sp. Marseille-Q4924 TaxID=2866571 RepID=UPI001CE47473|nr:hypothetical protein [Actinotalea sp. Marseille-Q4924]